MPPKPRFKVTIPSRYKQADFMDLILKWKEESLLHVSGGMLSMKCTNKTALFERFGKKFELTLSIFCGEADIEITEVV